MSDRFISNFSIHLATICVILFLHLFSTEICAPFYLKSIQKQLSQKELSGGKLYLKGEYESLLKHTPYGKMSDNFVFVFVKLNGDLTEEILYTETGERIEALYIDKKLKQLSGSTPYAWVSFAVPLVGFILTIFSILHQMVRTGKVFIWQKDDKQNRIEVLCYLYGLPFTFIGIFILVIKELWLKEL